MPSNSSVGVGDNQRIKELLNFYFYPRSSIPGPVQIQCVFPTSSNDGMKILVLRKGQR